MNKPSSGKITAAQNDAVRANGEDGQSPKSSDSKPSNDQKTAANTTTLSNAGAIVQKQPMGATVRHKKVEQLKASGNRRSSDTNTAAKKQTMRGNGEQEQSLKSSGNKPCNE